ncbi:MAG: universal stress protein [Terriglobales bacterium]|jgi:nucleotide-binding universal stress UspA family protein
MTTLAEVPQQQVVPQEAPVLFKNILLATDFSDASEKAFHYAVAIARLHGSKIYAVHVAPPETSLPIPEFPEDPMFNVAKRAMETLGSRSELKQIAHETLLRRGSVWSALSDVIRQRNIDLVVLGTHGRGGIKKLVLGSVAEEVVRRVGCPVITVGPHIDVPLLTTGEIHRILFATDFHPASEKALDYALHLANRFQAKLILLHVLPPAGLPAPGLTFYNEPAINEWQAKVKAQTKENLEKLLPPYVRLCSEPEYVVGFDFTAEGILKVAADRNVDLMVMGANRPLSAKVSAHVLGAVTYEVIRHAKCPVLTVSAGRRRLQEE